MARSFPNASTDRHSLSSQKKLRTRRRGKRAGWVPALVIESLAIGLFIWLLVSLFFPAGDSLVPDADRFAFEHSDKQSEPIHPHDHDPRFVQPTTYPAINISHPVHAPAWPEATPTHLVPIATRPAIIAPVSYWEQTAQGNAVPAESSYISNPTGNLIPAANDGWQSLRVRPR